MRCMRIRQGCGSNALRLTTGEKGLKSSVRGIIVISLDPFLWTLLVILRNGQSGVVEMALEFASHSSIRKIPKCVDVSRSSK
jgi:hypothetical protein